MNNNEYYMKLIFALLILAPLTSHAAWSLNDAANFPDGFRLQGEHRVRWENLDNQYRGIRNGGDQAIVFRTRLQADIDLRAIRFGLEGIDSRSTLTDSGSALSTSVVNPLDLLQAYAELPLTLNTENNDVVSIKAGRFTMDVGSRRFVARNRYRNTINNFTGVDVNWTQNSVSHLRFFYTLPVQRLVDGNLLNNDPAFDKQDEEVVFWGLYYSPLITWLQTRSEFYLFGLDEKDSPGRATRDRELYTTGFRFWKKSKPQNFDYQWESTYQWGNSRSSSASLTELDHKAYFTHAELGYQFEAPWQPRVMVQYDYASGDDSAADNDNNRFDTLFGARRFDFGPTSLFGAFARSNLSSPALRLFLQPASKLQLMTALRGFWLASSDDVWTTAGIASAGNSYIGTQLEARLRWNVVPGNIKTEAGFAHLFSGDVMQAAGKSDSHYLYTQLVLSF